MKLTSTDRCLRVVLIVIVLLTLWTCECDAWRRRRRRRCHDQDWVGWSPCVNCVRTRTRALCSGTISETDRTACNVHCSLSNWSEWSPCNAQCGKGVKTRKRYVVQPQSCGGTACTGAMDDTAPCDTGVCCPEDCQVNAWSEWTCTAKCMTTGKSIRTRTVSRQPSCGGATCPSLTEEATCKGPECCPKDCVVSEWTEWAICASVEGSTPSQGQRSRYRSVTSRESCGGAICPTDLSQTEACEVKEQVCKADCVFSSWSEWSSCDAQCGEGRKTRKRYITKAQSCGDDRCGGNLVESIACETGVCCPTDCQVNAWSEWTCTAKCESRGVKVRARTVSRNAECGGASCPALSEVDDCDGTCCPKDCVLSDWSGWSECSGDEEEGKGKQQRNRTVAIVASCGGKTCGNPNLSETKDCTVIKKDWDPPRVRLP